MLGKRVVFTLISFLILSFILAWISSGYTSLIGWGSFLAVIILAAVIVVGGWVLLRSESFPGWLGWLTIGAILLRLGFGIVWFTILPQWGHGTETELAGYVMSDAYTRDTTAWELAQSDKPLLTAFQDYRLADQYGGLLFISSALYRLFGGNIHKPLMVVVLTASFSGLSIPFLWAFTRRIWDASIAKIASWVFFFYPEAIMLGSSQMREAFLMTLACMALYGLVVCWQDRKISGIGWIGIALLVCLLISPVFTLYLLGVILVITLILDRFRMMRSRSTWLVLGFLVLAVIVGLWLLGERIFPNGAANPIALIHEWLRYAAKWEERTAAISSGWIDKIFQRSPDWMNLWIVLGYGTVQPFLPAALIATGNIIWKMIAIWRSIGWTFILVLLLYVPIRAFRQIRRQYIAAGLSVLVWATIITSAYRGGGDQWDNPRYRVVFVGLQLALAGWVWMEQKRKPDPWLRRILVGMGLVLAWFIPWYLRRYSPTFSWPVVDLFKTLTLGVISTLLYWIWDWVRVKDLSLLNDETQ